jgi:hypothetical protein
MSAAIAAVGVALVVLLTIPAVLVLRRRGRVRNETPLERYRREVVDFRYTTQARTSPRTWRRRRNNAGWVAGITAAGAAGGLGWPGRTAAARTADVAAEAGAVVAAEAGAVRSAEAVKQRDPVG